MDGDKSIAVTSDQQKLIEIAEPVAEAFLCVAKHFSTPIMAGSQLHQSLMAIRNIPLESVVKNHDLDAGNESTEQKEDDPKNLRKIMKSKIAEHKDDSEKCKTQQVSKLEIQNSLKLQMKADLNASVEIDNDFRKVEDNNDSNVVTANIIAVEIKDPKEKQTGERYSILNLVKPRNYKPKPGEMYAFYNDWNWKDFRKCLKIASKALSEHKYDKAKRMAEKAERMYPTPAAKALLEQIRIVTEAREEIDERVKDIAVNIAIEKAKLSAKYRLEKFYVEATVKDEAKRKKAPTILTDKENVENLKYKIKKKKKSVDKILTDKSEALDTNAARLYDFMRLEATFRFTVPNVHNFTQVAQGSVLSPPCIVRGLSWRLCAKPTTRPKRKCVCAKCFGVYLQCDGVAYSDWSCDVDAKLRLISHTLDKQPWRAAMKKPFTRDHPSWGIPCVIPWTELLDPAAGYIKDYAVTVEVYMKVENPKGIP